MKKIIIIGAGGHGQVVADILLNMRAVYKDLKIVGYVDDDTALHEKTRLNIPVIGRINELSSIEHDAVVVAVGDNNKRREIYRHLLKKGHGFYSAVHPKSVVAQEVRLGKGCMVSAGCILNCNTVIGDNVILNTGCTVDHHNIIENHAHIAPGVHLGGEVTIGEGTLIGIGATVMRGCSIGKESIVGAGAVVTRDIPDHCIATGIPAAIRTKE